MWKDAVIKACTLKGLPSQPLTKAKLTLRRYSSGEIDYDGLVGSFKSCVDGLQEAGVIINDKMSTIGRPDYDIGAPKPSPGKGFVTIKVESL